MKILKEAERKERKKNALQKAVVTIGRLLASNSKLMVELENIKPYKRQTT